MNGLDIYPATALAKAEDLRSVLETAVKNPVTGEIIEEEVTGILSDVEASRVGASDRYFAVALASGGAALGIMGLQQPEARMREYTTTPNSLEIINAYIDTAARGEGVGRKLLTHLEQVASLQGATELIVNSGPRYMLSGWPFWRRMYGEPVAIARGYYDGRYDAPVWRKSLTDNS